MSFAHDVWLIFKRQLRLSLRNPAWVVIALAQPILYLAFFGPLFIKVLARGLPGIPQANGYGFFVPGLLVQLGLFGAAFAGFSIIADWRAGVVERMRVTPVSRLAILLGLVAREVLVLSVQAVLLILAGFALGMRAPVAGIAIGIAFVAVLGVSLASVSYTLGLLTKSEDLLAPMLNMAIVPSMLLSGIMLPMALGPGWLQGIARGTPFGYVINAMRGAFSGHYFSVVMVEGIAVAVGLAAVCLFLGARAFLRENA